MGLPVKISSQCSIYIPITYMLAVGIDRYYDSLIRRQLDHQFIFYPYSNRPLLQNEVIVNLRAGATYLPKQWVTENGLVPGQDNLYMIGIDGGLLLSVEKKDKKRN